MSALALGSTKATSAARDCQCMTDRSKREVTFRKGIREGQNLPHFIRLLHGISKRTRPEGCAVESTGDSRVEFPNRRSCSENRNLPFFRDREPSPTTQLEVLEMNIQHVLAETEASEPRTSIRPAHLSEERRLLVLHYAEVQEKLFSTGFLASNSKSDSLSTSWSKKGTAVGRTNWNNGMQMNSSDHIFSMQEP